MEQTRNAYVVDKSPLPAQERSVFDALDALTQEGGGVQGAVLNGLGQRVMRPQIRLKVDLCKLLTMLSNSRFQ